MWIFTVTAEERITLNYRLDLFSCNRGVWYYMNSLLLFSLKCPSLQYRQRNSQEKFIQPPRSSRKQPWKSAPELPFPTL